MLWCIYDRYDTTSNVRAATKHASGETLSSPMGTGRAGFSLARPTPHSDAQVNERHLDALDKGERVAQAEQNGGAR